MQGNFGDTSHLPMLFSLILLAIGLYFRGTTLWVMVTFVLCFLLLIVRDSIITLVVYGFTALLVIAGYQRIKFGLKRTQLDGRVEPENPSFDLVIDGNNLLGLVEWDFEALKRFVFELQTDGFQVHLFFDHSIYRLLKTNKLMKPTETVPMTLCRIMEMNRKVVTVSKKGHKADALLIRYADRNRNTVLSNDKFNKSSEDRFYLKAAQRLAKAGLIKRVGLIQGKLTIL